LNRQSICDCNCIHRRQRITDGGELPAADYNEVSAQGPRSLNDAPKVIFAMTVARWGVTDLPKFASRRDIEQVIVTDSLANDDLRRNL